jgi:hypothetical protein
MITSSRIDRPTRTRHETPVQLPALDGPASTTPTMPLLQDAWSRAIERVLARRR